MSTVLYLVRHCQADLQALTNPDIFRITRITFTCGRADVQRFS
jgi:hypothetical protein